ncbi:MAG TPA: MFS transporter [Campylobacterales bacterium]|nr:MFS transporter [Campylobacterales bacterium]
MKTINKNIIALGFVSFFTDMASSMVTTILPLFIVYTLHEGVDKLGYVVAIATFISYAFRVLFGYLSDRYQVVKPFVVTGYFISAITKPLLYFSSSWQSVATLRGVERMGKSVRSATKDSLISAYSDGKSGKTFGFHKMMDIAGELIGSLIVFALLFWLGESEALFRNIFAMTLVPGLMAVVIALFFVQDAPYKSQQHSFNWREDYALFPPLFLYFGFIFFMFNDAFFLIKAKEVGIATVYIPLLVVVLNLTQTLLSYAIGLKIDSIGASKILTLSFIFGLLAMASLYLNWIVLGFIFLGIFTVASLNALRAYISDHAINKGTVYGVLYGGVALFGALGALVTGVIWKIWGEDGAILFSMVGMVVMLLIYLLVLKK